MLLRWAEEDDVRERLRWRSGRSRVGQAAFSLIELMVAMTILSIALLAFGGAVSTSTTQRQLSEERRAAEQALSSYLEQLRTMTIAQVLAEPATATPTIPGLSGVTRTLTVYRDEPGPGGPEGAALGFPVDINGDGDTTDMAVPPAEVLVLPTRLSLTWVGAARSPMEVRLYAYLSSF
ncbi:MAG: type II secretion system GspH family protein [Planctomycetes bacterium]|nr:type II secretion system GspH family protein [Planctomycetota bacterium]